MPFRTNHRTSPRIAAKLAAAFAAAALTATLAACAPITDAVSAMTSGGSGDTAPTKGSPDVTVRPVIVQGNALAAQDAFLSATDPVPETAATQAEAAGILARLIATAYPDLAAASSTLATEFLETECPLDPDPSKLPAADPATPIVACDTYAAAKYILGPSEASGADITSIAVREDSKVQLWAIDVAFNKAGTKAFETLSSRLTTLPSAESQTLDSAIAADTQSARISAALQLGAVSVQQQLALTRGDVVLTAPVMQAPITDGKLSISGAFTEEDTRRLAAYLSE